MAFEPNPRYASLPRITAVTLRLPQHPKAAARTVSDADAQKIADLWRKLPLGNGAKCFDPAYELIFLNGEKTVKRAQVCWRCSQSKIVGESTYAPFDNNSAEAKALLALCRMLLPPR